ncbi:MAG: thermonuclease family protein [Candidatus Omnitrophica bacterium]|nr:thermonuclease family protein [Candidatus Omnitrophota bacterium]
MKTKIFSLRGKGRQGHCSPCVIIFLAGLAVLLWFAVSRSPAPLYPPQADKPWHFVKYVVDGDTVILEDGEHIRLIGINAPEVESPYHPQDECYGPEARAYLRQWITGEKVRLENGPEYYDKYKRRLAYIYLPDGTMINREMIRFGYAEATAVFQHPYREEFLRLEQSIKAKKVGVWNCPDAEEWGMKYKEHSFKSKR